jgi:hypothetical protein
MKGVSFLALCLALAGCTGAIRMVNARTGQTATCGPFADSINTPARESQCIGDYQRQGFERAP